MTVDILSMCDAIVLVSRAEFVVSPVSNSNTADRLNPHRFLKTIAGEELTGDCGHCGPCLGDVPTTIEPRCGAELQIGATEIASVRSGHPEALGSPRRMARFLCGLSSPKLTKSRLTRHPLFGCAGEVPFADVLRFASR